MIKPYKLNIGDKVAIVSLSRGLLGKDSFEELLEHPEYRAQDLKDAYKDDSIKCIINAVGGFDTFRTYEYLMNDEDFLYNILPISGTRHKNKAKKLNKIVFFLS